MADRGAPLDSKAVAPSRKAVSPISLGLTGQDQEAGVGLPVCQLPTGSSPCMSLSANSSIMLRSYSSIVSILSPWMPAMRSRRRVRVSGARRMRAVIFCEGLRGLREHNGELVGDAAWPAIIDRATHDRLVGLLDDPSRRWREPHLPSTCAHRGRAAGGVCGGLRDRPVAEPRSQQDRAVRLAT